MRDGHVDSGCHRPDVAGRLREQIAALDGRQKAGRQLVHIRVGRMMASR